MSELSRLRCSLCTITFRHTLISFEELVQFAKAQGFDGLEVWGAHARHLYKEREGLEKALLEGAGLTVSMISDYLDVGTQVNFVETIAKCKELLVVADWLGTSKIRTFAGMRGSREVDTAEFEETVRQLRILGDLCMNQGMELLVETHPGTLADHMEAAYKLMMEVNHEAVRLNLDFLHMWEAGDDPLESYELLAPWVAYFHLKNVTSLSHCSVFQPHQVYAANGSRKGMVSLENGAVNYRPIIDRISQSGKFASLEWFGADPMRVLKEEIGWLHHRLNRLHSVLD
ncbi:3-dehydroshikimate dehydratase [Paenibacillus sp. Soil766]|uniref:sugar phosphate isomerase/epimerase family protein n=1 Tax=Paenibacillus sp. Soil766 TaxID=1736404 RepID=UPI0007110E50|nr:sugar phosphate isomerase/epimerase family protein [Paenibacillus sp. Soil766]KRF07126.1 3-dehydroshikimate dehydratase [Paenibacillus sp. Soil766]